MVQIQGVSKSFEGKPILRDLSLQLQPRQVYGLLGPNGSGKTTTINLICQRLRPDQGQILVEGQPLSALPRAWIGVATQETILYRSLTCREHLSFFARIYGLPQDKARQQIQFCLQAVDLERYADQQVAQLSGGIQRRLHIALALIHRPRLLILDEPTTGLDIEARYQIWELIRTLRSEAMVLLTTHLFEEAERVCDRIGILHQGRLVAEGSLAQLRQQLSGPHQITLVTSEVESVIRRAAELGYQIQHRDQTVILQLSQPLDLRQVMEQFPQIRFESLSCTPIRLEEIYLQLTRKQT